MSLTLRKVVQQAIRDWVLYSIDKGKERDQFFKQAIDNHADGHYDELRRAMRSFDPSEGDLRKLMDEELDRIIKAVKQD